MPERPAHCYRYFDTPAYTRKEYIRGVPGSKITKFDYGDPNGDFPAKVRLIPLEGGQIRHNALEAARVIATKHLQALLGDKGFHLKVRAYPHQVLRENKMMAFAGADRLQDGMRRSFGKPAGTAARFRALQPIIDVRVPSDKKAVAKEALKLACAKMPMPCRVIEVE
ncbi:MAG: 50S ribosomal protein L16 [Candidatus Verstraetearchaeota archaeon]|nr:50S ribosomal protein L16 [Candidatus Verstraetearchaeota archaeon]